MRIDIDQQGLDRAKAYFRRMSRNARDLWPLANKALERWRESESRTFASNARWAPRKPGTIVRYRWPINTLNGPRMGRSKARGTGFYTGGLRKALTTAHQPGIKDRVHIGRGRLTVDVGIKGGRSPRAYGNWFNDGAGARPARPVVTFDEIAQQQLSDDTQTHVMPGNDR